MFDYEVERDEALYYESLNDGEYAALQVAEYAREYGAESPDVAWISTPYDSWEPNPHYDGRYGDVPHPESY